MDKLSHQDIAKLIDHALLKPQMTRDEVKAGSLTALKYGAASVCARSCDVAFVHDILKGSDVMTGTVIGFPHGTQSTAAKVAETAAAIKDGAAEVDMVIPIGLALSGEYNIVRDDIAAVLKTAHGEGAALKVIFENCYLNDEVIVRLCELCSELEVDFVKTSTGFGTSGAKLADVKLMRAHTRPQTGVKASGGIHTLDELLAMVEAGANRIGASATEAIVEEAIKRGL